MLQGWGFGVWGLGLGFCPGGLGFRGSGGLGFSVWGLGSGFGDSGPEAYLFPKHVGPYGLGNQNFGFTVYGFGVI